MPEREQLNVRKRRPVWSGTLAFGLVTLPVELYPTVRPGRGSLRMIGPTGQPLARRYYSESGKELLQQDDIVRGFEVGDGEFVLIEDEELEALDPDHSRVISLDSFVPLSDIDPVLVENTYVLVPGKDAAPAYRLLVAAMAEAERAGIARFVLRDKAHLVAIVSREGSLRTMTLRYHDEVRTPEQIGLPEPEPADVELIGKIEKAAGKLTGDVLDENLLRDEASGRLEQLVKRKLSRHEDVHEMPAEDPDDEDDFEPTDVMELLRRSLESEGKRPG